MNEAYEQGKTYWMPADWMDEGPLPNLVAEPVDLVEQDPDGSWWLRPLKDDLMRESAWFHTPLTPGDAVAWDARRMYGDRRLTVSHDRTFECEGFPADATCFALSDNCDTDAIFDSLSELVEQGNMDDDSLGTPLRPGTYDVEGWCWSGNHWFVFKVTDGKPEWEARVCQ
jgi:hypothetical protein